MMTICDALRTGSRSLLRGAWVLIILTAGPALTTAQPAEGLFQPVKNEMIIAEQMRLALPQAIRGFQLLAASADAEHTNAGVQALSDSYRYLRAAQQGSEMVYNYGKFPDPLLKIRIDRLWQIRLRLLKCVDNKGYLTDPADPIRAQCLEGLPEGIQRLRLLVGTLP